MSHSLDADVAGVSPSSSANVAGVKPSLGGGGCRVQSKNGLRPDDATHRLRRCLGQCDTCTAWLAVAEWNGERRPVGDRSRNPSAAQSPSVLVGWVLVQAGWGGRACVCVWRGGGEEGGRGGEGGGGGGGGE
jgi:hypothetical protein